MIHILLFRKKYFRFIHIGTTISSLLFEKKAFFAITFKMFRGPGYMFLFKYLSFETQMVLD